jgi:hypothetical protein
VYEADKKKKLTQAKQHCCNWVNTICVGAMMKHVDGAIHQKIDKKYADKPCKAHDCQYFEQVVVPGIQNEY